MWGPQEPRPGEVVLHVACSQSFLAPPPSSSPWWDPTQRTLSRAVHLSPIKAKGDPVNYATLM